MREDDRALRGAMRESMRLRFQFSLGSVLTLRVSPSDRPASMPRPISLITELVEYTESDDADGDHDDDDEGDGDDDADEGADDAVGYGGGADEDDNKDGDDDVDGDDDQDDDDG